MPESSRQLYLADEAATVALGARLAGSCPAGCVIYLHGPLGAGKTTLARGLLQALGHRGAVKSPTYTLVEPYALPAGTVYHFDLYRLGDPEELELIGIRDYFRDARFCLIEWPERGEPLLPVPDLSITLSPDNDGGRQLTISAQTARAQAVLAAL